MRLLILYEELAWYFVNCLNELAGRHEAKVLLVCRRPNATAPFRFPFVHPNVQVRVRDEQDDEALLKEIKSFAPQGVYVGGWNNRFYLDLVRSYKNLPTAMGFDNQWTGSPKQRAGALYFRMFIKPFVAHAFVPGAGQHEFAQRLGFAGNRITTGAYCCDYERFSDYYARSRGEKEQKFPKRFLFVGRYAEEKAVNELWGAFIDWQKKSPNGWELWCLGKGGLEPPAHEKIRHFGFRQPDELADIIANTGVFVLPSRFEPWGVVVHEFAAAGYPLLLSRQTGAAAAFCEDGRNGYLVDGGSRQQLIEKMNTFSSLKDNELLAMAQRSTELAAAITPAVWADRFIKMFEYDKA
jgi:glycosyltransferase involved in cell wall biosynthesis